MRVYCRSRFMSQHCVGSLVHWFIELCVSVGGDLHLDIFLCGDHPDVSGYLRKTVDFGKSTYSGPKKGLGDPTPTKNYAAGHRTQLYSCNEMSTVPNYGRF